MKVNTGLDQSLIEELVKAFTGNTDDVLNDVKREYGWDTGNFKNGGSWDHRFERIKQVALHNNLVVLKRNRGIWTFICLLNIETGILYVFSKEKNLEKVIKNFGRKSIHYFHAFISINSGPVELYNQQMSLFSVLPEDYEERRLTEVQKILGEEYPSVNQVIFIVAQEENRKIVGVEAHYYNRYFELIDNENWSSYVPEDEYGSIFVAEEESIDNTDIVSVIPKVKQKVIDQKHKHEKEISKRKPVEHGLKEKGNS
ncbi:hypothetical protein HXA35_06900 [Bacillus sp. A301a_S52]|nr:hypothetical protein [Bacillus sp. A301a_S52]